MGNKSRKSKNGIYYGVCTFHTETGTEGGFWAFQDGQFIQKNVNRGYCKKCGLQLKERDGTLKSKTTLLSAVKELLLDDEVHEIERERTFCPVDEHEEKIGDAWSYEGLYVLKDGDYLKIYSKEDAVKVVVWSGIIKLNQYQLFTEHAFGWWIHSEQKGIDREKWAKWFFGEYPARLTIC